MTPDSPKLDRTLIIETAFAVLDEAGLDGLSLRLLASRLGVQAPALYWHVRNKAELIGLMAATFSAAAAAAVPDGPGWQAILLAHGRALRRALLRHRDAARLCAVAQPIEAPESMADRLARPLVLSGLDGRRALACQAAVISLTLGWVVFEQNREMHDHLAPMLDFETAYEAGLGALVRGFASGEAPASARAAG